MPGLNSFTILGEVLLQNIRICFIPRNETLWFVNVYSLVSLLRAPIWLRFLGYVFGGPPAEAITTQWVAQQQSLPD